MSAIAAKTEQYQLIRAYHITYYAFQEEQNPGKNR